MGALFVLWCGAVLRCAVLCCAVLCNLAGSLVIAVDCCVWNAFTDVCVYAYLYDGPHHIA